MRRAGWTLTSALVGAAGLVGAVDRILTALEAEPGVETARVDLGSRTSPTIRIGPTRNPWPRP